MMTMMTHPLQSPAWSAPGWPWSSSRRCWWSRCRARSTPGRCPRSSAEGSDRTGTGISLERRILRDPNVELGRRNQNNTFAAKQKEEECWRQKEPRLNWRRLYEIARDCRRNEESGKYILWFSQFNLFKMVLLIRILIILILILLMIKKLALSVGGQQQATHYRVTRRDLAQSAHTCTLAQLLLYTHFLHPFSSKWHNWHYWTKGWFPLISALHAC